MPASVPASMVQLLGVFSPYLAKFNTCTVEQLTVPGHLLEGSERMSDDLKQNHHQNKQPSQHHHHQAKRHHADTLYHIRHVAGCLSHEITCTLVPNSGTGKDRREHALQWTTRHSFAMIDIRCLHECARTLLAPSGLQCIMVVQWISVYLNNFPPLRMLAKLVFFQLEKGRSHTCIPITEPEQKKKKLVGVVAATVEAASLQSYLSSSLRLGRQLHADIDLYM